MFESVISPSRLRSASRHWVAVAGLALMLGGCAATRPGVDLPQMVTWDQRQVVLGEIREWAFRGRIAVKAGDDGFNGKFNWTQDGEAFHASVGGPLGIGTVLIEGDNSEIVLTDKDGVRTELVDPERELYARYGWTIPVSSLRYWALGIPEPGTEADTDIDSDGRLVSLSQRLWSVEISRYREHAGQQMPRIMTATNADTRVRMVIDKWTFYETGSEPL